MLQHLDTARQLKFQSSQVFDRDVTGCFGAVWGGGERGASPLRRGMRRGVSRAHHPVWMALLLILLGEVTSGYVSSWEVGEANALTMEASQVRVRTTPPAAFPPPTLA
jgi:hypothetical protein